jgi:multiple sugar transport system permease protein
LAAARADIIDSGRASGPAAPLRRGLSFARRRQLFLLMFGAPAVLYVLVVAVWPLAQGIAYSFYDYSLLRPAARAFVGLDNYRALYTNDAARNSILTTMIFTVSAVTLEFVAGLALALLLWRDSAFQRACLALLLIPVTVTPIVVGLVFRALLAPDYGMIGYYLAQWGISSPRGFFGDPATALGTLVFVDAWQWTPFMALILLAGLKSLPSDVLEAAEADGATPAQRLRIVVLPMLLPAVFLALVLRTMDAFRVFDIIFATTNGGPADATDVLMIYAVKQGLQFFNIGFAAAISNMMIVCIAIFSVVFVVLIRRADRHANEIAR